MSSAEETLKELGLGKNEIKVYLALLSGKRLDVAQIATKSSVHRVNVYDALRKLLAEGIISQIEVSKKHYYQANSPEALEQLLKQKEDKIRAIIPELKKYYEKSENSAQIFEGLDGIKLIIKDLVKTGEKIQAFGIPKILPELLKNFLVGFHRDRIAKKIQIDHIYNENAKERIAFLNKIKYSRAKYLPEEYNVPATTLIYGDKVAFWIWSDEPFSILIESRKMAQTYSKYFELLWKLAK